MPALPAPSRGATRAAGWPGQDMRHDVPAHRLAQRQAIGVVEREILQRKAF
jgi:hypothetical protein